MLFTFYSFKGGVGRSMAMANVANVLAQQGLRVLAIDFDLEAPGLERYFRDKDWADEACRHAGVMELLLAYKRAMAPGGDLGQQAEFRRLDDYILPVYPSLKPGCLDMMPAGRRGSASEERRYALNVRGFDWQDFHDNWEGSAFFDWLKRKLVGSENRRYDIVVVDSRTGVTEMGGVCAFQLADVVVMMCAANVQNVEGTGRVARDFLSGGNARSQIIVVPARIERGADDDPLFEDFRARFLNEFGRTQTRDYLPAALRELGVDFLDLLVPYEPRCAFREQVVTGSEGARPAIADMFERLAHALVAVAAYRPASPAGESSPAPASGAPTEALERLAEAARARLRALHATAQEAPAVEATAARAFDPTQRSAGHDVYLSFRGSGREIAQRLSELLRNEGLSVFQPETDLAAGREWSTALREMMSSSRYWLFCIGANGVGGYQRREIQFAWEQARQRAGSGGIVPLLLPGADAGALRAVGMDAIQAVDLSRWNREAASGEFQLLIGLLKGHAEKAQGTTSESAVQTSNPYPGLEAFGETMQHYFFGRERDASAVVESLKSNAVTIVSGPSGAGKTSLIVAGILAPWRKGVLTDLPLKNVVRLDGSSAEFARLAAEAAANPQESTLVFVDHLDAALRPDGELAAADAEAARALGALLDRAGADFKLLVAWRELPASTTTPGATRGSGVEAHPYLRLRAMSPLRLAPPDESARTAAVEQPAQREGRAVEPGLALRLSRDAGADATAYSNLQLALPTLWDQQARGWLTNDAYDRLGGVRAAVLEHAERSLRALQPDEQRLAARVLLRLIAQGDDGRWRRTDAYWSSLRTQPSIGRGAWPVIGKLVTARIVTAWYESSTDIRLELNAALLVADWPWLKEQVVEQKDVVLGRQTIDNQLQEWLRANRDRGALLSGKLLEQARGLRDARSAELDDRERDYIAASERALVTETRRFRLGFSGGLVAILVFGGIAVYSTKKETASTDIRQEAANLIAQGRTEQATALIAATSTSPLTSTRVFIQYLDKADGEWVERFGRSLVKPGVIYPGKELVRALTCGDVRYFRPEDREAAEKTKQALEQALRESGASLSVNLIELTGKFDTVRPNTIEIWLPPLAPYRQVFTDAAVNAPDGAELRAVRPGCYRAGTAFKERQQMLTQLKAPWADIFNTERPIHNEWLPGFYMYRYEVTNEQFAVFKEAACSGPDAEQCPKNWKARSGPKVPVTFVSWHHGNAYCRWAGGRLPSEEEWEKAARGPNGKTFPWGEELDETRFQGRSAKPFRPVDVGSYSPRGDSPYGIADLAGNVWEMTSSIWEDQGHTMKGGSYLNILSEVRGSVRWASNLEDRGSDSLGFRCVVEAKNVSAKKQ